MDTFRKAEILGQAARYDLCGSGCGPQPGRKRDDLGRWIYPAALPDGRKVALLKVLLSNVCHNDCAYCANCTSRDFPRTSFAPEELARAFDQMRRKGLVKGLFLSSGVGGDVSRTMDAMIATVELVRTKYVFSGYVHLKLLPGASWGHVERAVQLATRVSVNLEAPNAERLAQIAPGKDFQTDLMQPMQWARQLIEEAGGRLARAGQTTQFIVGAAGESDREILATTSQLYEKMGLARAYFSGFQPVAGTALENHPAAPPLREHRLYQSDWLLRQYGFSFAELIFDDQGGLPRQADPKMMWALTYPERFPIEVNRASREELLRVPGLGPRSVARILRLRRKGAFRSPLDLTKVGAVVSRAMPFVLLDGKRPACQFSLW